MSCKIKSQIIRLLLAFCCILIGACSSYPDDVNNAILSSKTNKTELIKALQHYNGNDKLKADAIEFLIANMPNHCGLDTAMYSNELLSVVFDEGNDSLRADYMLKKSLESADSTNLLDIEALSSIYLINLIESSFTSIHEQRGDSIPTQIFHRYLLPYRVNEEPMTINRDTIAKYFMDILHPRYNIAEKISRYNDFVKRKRRIWRLSPGNRHLGIPDIFMSAKTNDCKRMSALTCQVFRACGIPTCVEYTPQWRNNDNGHFWCAVYSDSKFQPFTPPYNNISDAWDSSIQYAGKIYRYEYVENPDAPCIWAVKESIIPESFSNRFLHDVTNEYHTCVDIDVDFDDNISFKGNVAYISFFNAKQRTTLHPVGWGIVDKTAKRVHYKSVPINTLFFPSHFDDYGECKLLSTPFIVTISSEGNKCVKKLHIDSTKKETVKLLRKYPQKPHLRQYNRNLIGAKLLASKFADGPYDTIYTIKNEPIDNWNRYLFQATKAYQYYKMIAFENDLNISEIELLTTDKSNNIASTLPIYDLESLEKQDNLYKLPLIAQEPLLHSENATDGKLDTYAESKYFSFKLQKPARLYGFQLYPRSAQNEITPNHKYLLRYFNGSDWIMMKPKVAQYNYITFDNVPKNALLWLKDLTMGKDELPFFYVNGEQIFIDNL